MSLPNTMQAVAPQIRDSKISTTAPSGTTMTVTLPTVVAGDLLFVSVCTTATVTTPAGYGLVDSQTGSDAKLYVFSRTATGSEGASLAVTIGSNNQTVATAVSVIGASVSGSTQAETTTGTSLTLSLATNVQQSMVLAFQGAADGVGQSSVPPGSFTELQDGKAQFDFRQASVSYVTATTAGNYGGTFTIAPSGAISLIMISMSATRTSPVNATQVVSTGVQASQLGGVATSQLGATGGVATLDSTKNVPTSQLANAATAAAVPTASWETFQDPGVGGRVVKVLVSQNDSKRIYVSGDMLGVGVSTDGGQTFGGGYGLPSWEMGSFTEHPTDPLTVWCGSMSGPVKSVDGGQNWTLKRSGMPNTLGNVFSAPVEKVLFDPTNSLHLLAFGGSWRIWKFFSGGGVASGGYGSVWESTNGGNSWTLKSSIPSNENIMWATGASDWSKIWINTQHNGIYVSSDQGASWSQSNTGLLHLAGTSVVLDPNSSNLTLYSSLMASNTISATLSTGLSTGGAITSLPINAFASTSIPSGGTLPSGTTLSLTTSGHSQTWTLSAPLALGATTAAVSSATPNFAYPTNSAITTFLPGGAYKSTDAGATWALAGTGQPQAQSTTQGFCTSLDAVHLTTDGVLYFGDQNTGGGANNKSYKSVNSGATWTQLSPSVTRYFPGPLNVHAYFDDPATPGTVWGGTNDGLIYTTDAGTTWHDGADFIANSGQVRGRGYSGVLGVRVAFNRWRRGWISLQGFDSANFMLTKDGGQSWSGPLWSFDFFDGGYDTAFGGSTGGVIYALLGQAGIFNGVAVSQDAGATWSVKSGGTLPGRFANLGSGDQNGLEIISTDGSTCLVAYGGTLYKTANFGSTWATVAGLSPSDVAATTDLTTICTVSPNQNPRISTDGGTTWTADTTAVHLTRVVASPDGTFWGVGYFGRFGGGVTPGLWHRTAGAAPQVWTNASGLVSQGGTYAWGCEDVAVDPYDASHIVVANDQNPFNDISTAGGILESKDGGASWKQQNSGLRLNRAMSVAFDPWEAGRVVCGTDGGGFFTSKLYGANTPTPKGIHSGVAGVTDVPDLETRLRKLQNEIDVPSTQPPPTVSRTIVAVPYATTVTPALPIADAVYNVGTLTGVITINVPSGTPIEGQLIEFRLTQDGAGHAVTWGAGYVFGTDVTAALDPPTASAKWRRLFQYNAATLSWEALAIVRGF